MTARSSVKQILQILTNLIGFNSVRRGYGIFGAECSVGKQVGNPQVPIKASVNTAPLYSDSTSKTPLRHGIRIYRQLKSLISFHSHFYDHISTKPF